MGQKGGSTWAKLVRRLRRANGDTLEADPDQTASSPTRRAPRKSYIFRTPGGAARRSRMTIGWGRTSSSWDKALKAATSAQRGLVGETGLTKAELKEMVVEAVSIAGVDQWTALFLCVPP